MRNLANYAARDIASPAVKMGNKGLFPGRVSEANRGRGQPRRGYRRPKPATRSGAGRKSCRAAGFLLHTFLSPPKEKCERPIVLQALPSRRSRRVKPPSRGGFLAAKLLPIDAMQGGFPLAPLHPLRGVCVSMEQGIASAGALGAFLGANNRRGSHCRALRLLFA